MQTTSEDSFKRHLAPTAILDYEHPRVMRAVHTLEQSTTSEREFIQSAHKHIANVVRPIYTINEWQACSDTLERGYGSCSQRMACLEAFARSHGIATRPRAVWVAGRFWHSRFQWVKPFIPKRILLIWPQFWLERQWTDFDEIFAPVADLALNAEQSFANDGETLFEAVEHTAIDFFGKLHQCESGCPASDFDLTRYILSDAGFFASRDELLAELGTMQHTWRGRVFEAIYGGRKSRHTPV